MQAAVNRNAGLTDEERYAMLACLDGYQPHERITGAFYFLDIHLPRKFLLPALGWLQRNKLVGARLDAFLREDCEDRYLQFQKKLLVAIHKEPELRMQAGKNIIL